MSVPQSPLTDANYREINRALAILNEHAIKCDLAEKAGYDVSEHRAANEYYRQMFDRTKATYFPHKP